MSEETGAKALNGEEEHIHVKLFKGVDYERMIIGRGESIMIYNPNEAMTSPAYWEHNDDSKDGEKIVPKGYNVRVIGATVKFTRVPT